MNAHGTRYVTIKKFCEFSGYTEDAVKSKRRDGVWLEGKVWIKAPDGRILIDLSGYEAWVGSGAPALPLGKMGSPLPTDRESSSESPLLEGTRVMNNQSAEFKTALRANEIFAARHPRPTQVNMTQAAEMLGLSRPTVRNLLKLGKLKLNGCGLIPIEQVDALLAARAP